MTIAKKPTTAEKFISKAKADMNRPIVKKRKRTIQKPTPAKITKLTFYMTEERYLAWQKYKLDQLARGNKVTFQGIIEQYLDKLLT